MAESGLRAIAAIAFVGVLVLAGAGLAGNGLAPRSSPTSSPAPDNETSPAASTVSAQSASPTPPAPVVDTGSVSGLGGGPAASMASRALSAAKAAGVAPDLVLVPRPSASPAEIAAADAGGAVVPLYRGTPAPMGLADYGLSAGPGGTVVGSVLNTTRLEATVDFSSTGVVAGDLYNNESSSFSVQLNAVLTNVTLLGVPGYSFWTQNVLEYFPTQQHLLLLTNVWNFSSPTANVTPQSIYSHGPWGTDLVGDLGYYYASYAVPMSVVYPYNVTLLLTSTLVGGRDAVEFDVQLNSSAHPAENFSSQAITLGGSPEPFDDLVFNSLPAGGPPLAVPSNYTADGLAYNPIGLTDDFELAFGGPGAGTQATLVDADATLGLAYWTGTAFASVPSAYNYGGETGETSTGANVAWSDAGGGPASLPTYATMTTGPSILSGLWNATLPEGSYPVTVHASPSNAFTLVEAVGAPANFTVSEASYAPSLDTSTFYLAPGNYSFRTELSDFDPVVTNLTVAGPVTLWVNLSANASRGIYTPLWAWTNAQLASLATGGAGTPSDPYVIENVQPGPIGPAFGLYNDYTFPVYPAVFLYGTTASVEFDRPPSFATLTNTFQEPGPELPAENDLQYWFWNVSNVAVVNAANVSGWFGTFFITVGSLFSQEAMIFFEGGHDLVANDTFDSEGGGALLLYSGPQGIGGGNITVWGNTFLESSPPPSSALLGGGPWAIQISESNDSIYNNYVDTPWTCYMANYNFVSGIVEFWNDTFNISRQPATNVHYAVGFPYEPLTGSILGTSYQGGNYWWDYGIAVSLSGDGASDPYGQLPYNEGGWIIFGGDWVPLVAVTLTPAVVRVTGLPEGPVGHVEVEDVASGAVLDDYGANRTPKTIYLPSGTYRFQGIAPAGWSARQPSGVVKTETGRKLSVAIGFSPTPGYRTLTFRETGLVLGEDWSLEVTSAAGDDEALNVSYFEQVEAGSGHSVSLRVLPGTYNYSASGDACSVPPHEPNGSVRISTAAAGRTLRFPLAACPISFFAEGLPAGTSWGVEMRHTGSAASTTLTSENPSIVFQLLPGGYTFEVLAPAGFVASPETNAFSFTETSWYSFYIEFSPSS
jgi:thermopsin